MDKVTFIDVETTGFSTSKHEIIEIYAAQVDDDLRVYHGIHAHVLPMHIEDASVKALEINHYDADRWAKLGRTWPDVWHDFRGAIRGAIDGSILVGHNIGFDVSFILAMNKRYDIDLPNIIGTLDTMAMAAPLKASGQVSSLSLTSLCEHFDIDVNAPAHTANGDVYRTIELFKRLRGM